MSSPPGLDLERLLSYLRHERPGLVCRGPLSAELIGGGRSNLTYRVTDGVGRWVVRRPPLRRAELLDDTAVLASNTSSLPIAAIANTADRPERVLGLHLFNPPNNWTSSS